MSAHLPLMSEEALQQTTCKILEAYARPDIEWHHVPNGGKRDKRTANLMKLAGVRPGVADWMFLIDGLSFALELKTEVGVQSQDQIDFQERFERAGGKYFIAFGLDEALGVLAGLNVFRPGISFTSQPLLTRPDGLGVRRGGQLRGLPNDYVPLPKAAQLK